MNASTPLNADLAPATLPTPVAAKPAGPYQSFPTQLLPMPLNCFVHEAAQTLDGDPAWVTLPLLAEVAAAIGNARLIRLKRSWREPAVIWAATIGPTGALPAAALKLALEAIQLRQGQAVQHHALNMAKHKTQMEKRNESLELLLKPKPQPPQPLRHLLVGDITLAGLARRLEENPRGLLLALDDLGGWFGQLAAAGGAQHYLGMMHQAAPLKIDTQSFRHPTVYLPHPAVSICGSINPGQLPGLYADDGALSARLLLAMPPAAPAKWSDAEVSDSTLGAMDRLYTKLYQLEGLPDADGAIHPVEVTFSPAAQTRFVDFVNQLARQSTNMPTALAAAWSQLPGYAARLALIVHCCRHATDETAGDAMIVDEPSAVAGIGLAEWFAAELQRIHRSLHESDADRHRRQLLQWITAQGGCVSARDLQRGPRRYRRDANSAEAALRELVDQGYGNFEQIKLEQGPPEDVFHLMENPNCPVLQGGGDRISIFPRKNGDPVAVAT